MLHNYFQKQLDRKIVRGIIVIDKESGITSHDEVDRLRRVFKTRKVGHSGTLDPKVTGVLVCGLGRGTKVLQYVLLSEKVYDCEIIFHKPIGLEQCKQVMQEFQGVINQLPPVRSRVKRVEREREVYGLELLNFASDGRSALMRCRVERGTYIRKLCHDMGEQLGTGAHMGDLRRIAAGPLNLKNSQPIQTVYLQTLMNKTRNPFFGWWYLYKIGQYIEPIERILEGVPQVVVDDGLEKPIRSGAPIYVPGVIGGDQYESGDMVCVMNRRGVVWAVGTARMSNIGVEEQERGIVATIDKVLV